MPGRRTRSSPSPWTTDPFGSFPTAAEPSAAVVCQKNGLPFRAFPLLFPGGICYNKQQRPIKTREGSHGAPARIADQTEAAPAPAGPPGGGTHGQTHHLPGGRPRGPAGPAPKGRGRSARSSNWPTRWGWPSSLGEGLQPPGGRRRGGPVPGQAPGGLTRLEREGGRPACMWAAASPLAQAATFAAQAGGCPAWSLPTASPAAWGAACS